MAGIGTTGFGPGSASRFSNNQSTTGNNVRYPSPWWDISNMDLPRSVKHLFKWCLYHVLVNPLVAPVVRKMAAYPITEIIIEDEPHEGFQKHKERWEDCLFKTLNIDQFQLEIGLDYHGYGNALVSLLTPFHKVLTCTHCKYEERIKKLKFGEVWDFKEFKFILHCPKCKMSATAKVDDVSYRSFRDLKIIRWNPADIDIDFNPITRVAEYAYNIPERVKTKILRKNKRYLEEIPQVIFQAMKEQRAVLLNPDNLYHFKAPTPSLPSSDEGWGYPPILPALKDSFYLQQMKKAQEMVLLEHMLPLDIFFPASADANANPYQMINLHDWKQRVEAEITRWKWDPNYKPIMPIPVGHQRIGGNGKALMLTQEIRAWSEHIIAGMGVPQEFAFGGLTWSGSSVSLRMLENQFSNYRSMHENFLQNWLIPRIANYMAWSEISIHLRDFKMADDMQLKQLLITLNQMKKISDKTLLAEFGRDALEESKLMEQEMQRQMQMQRTQMMYTTQIQVEASAIQMKGQMKMQEQQMKAQQKAMGGQAVDPQTGMPMQGAQGGGVPGTPAQGPQGGQEGQSVDVRQLAEAYGKKLANMPPEQAAPILHRMSQENPQLHMLVMQAMQTNTTADMRPLPEQRPPTRETGLV